MSRQTVFPGIIVESIQATAGGGGRTLDFEEGLPEDIPSERIQSLFDNIRLFGSDFVDNEVTYTLLVASYTSLSAALKSKAFVRAKNPFEPDVIDVSTPVKDGSLGVLRGGRNVFRVRVEVEK